MHKYRMLFLVVMLVAGFLRPAGSSQAQSPQSEAFMAAGVNNLLVYPAANQTEADVARDTVIEILAKLRTLFTGGYEPLGFESLVHLVDEASPYFAEAGLETPTTATTEAGVTHSFSTSQVCVITVYQAGIQSLAILPFNLAHEISHCLQEFYIAPTRVNLELSGWWVEGIAEWAAMLVYPDLAYDGLFNGPGPSESLFLAHNNHALTDSASGGDDYGGYGSYFFWLYLTSLGDTSTVIDLISRVPQTPSGEEAYQDFLASELDSAAIMGHLGVMLAQERIPYQMSPLDLFGSSVPIQLPQSVNYAPNDFTLDFNAFDVARASDEVKAVEISTSGLGDPSNDVLLAVEVGGVYTYVSDGAPVLICLQQDNTLVPTVLTRGDGDGAADIQINFTPIMEEDSPCTDPVIPGEARGYPAWRAVNVGNPDTSDERVLFLDVTPDTTIEVWYGPDIVYGRSGGTGPFTGTTLQPPGYDSFEATLEILDASTRASTSVGVAGVMTYESSYEFFLTDEIYLLMTEINRTVLDYSMFSSCIGFEVIEPGRTWTTPDPLVPLRVDAGSGTLYLGGRAFVGSNIVFTETTSDADTGLETVFTIAVTGQNTAHIHFESTLDGRADCRIVYESMLIPFNGELEELIASAGE